MSLNKVMVIGHLGRDPESTNLPSGMLVTKFSLATTEKSKIKNIQNGTTLFCLINKQISHLNTLKKAL